MMIKILGIANDLMLLLTLLTSLLTMPLLLLFPRKKNLCRSPSNIPKLPSFLKMDKIHVLVTFPWGQRQSLLFPRSCPKVFGAKLFSCSQSNRSNILPLVLILKFCKAVKRQSEATQNRRMGPTKNITNTEIAGINF